MDAARFDTLVRSWGLPDTRRAVLGILGGGLAGSLARLGRDAAAGKKRKHKKQKLKRNSFGCVIVGNACRGKSANCCSGICQGKKPKRGKADKSKCIAHNEGGCQADADGCLEISPACGQGGACYRTTGEASFCGTDGAGACIDCATDADCEALGFASGAACVVCTSCNVSATACFPPAG
jgi:hypothetical protein